MSKETLEWLNTNTLIGFTEKRGNAWHYRASDQGERSNHYPGAIPVADVVERLFFWEAARGTATATWLLEDGITSVEDTKRFPVGRPDTGVIFNYVADGYAIHQYPNWLLENVSNILDSQIGIGSAGLLRGGGQAWVSVEVPDSITTPEGVEFRPNLLACTSHDGSLATTYKKAVTHVVCDNTMAAGLAEQGQQIKIKHSRYSHLRLSEARDALAIIHTVADDFAAEVKALCEVKVSDKAWSEFLKSHTPMPEKGRGVGMADRERQALTRLWNSDNRVSPWRGTAWGVVQAVNTFVHHEGIVRGASRPERNMSRAITGKSSDMDQSTVRELDKVLASF